MDQWEEWRELMEQLAQRITGDADLEIAWGSQFYFGNYVVNRIELNRFGVQYLGPDGRLGVVLHEVAHALYSPAVDDLKTAFRWRRDGIPFDIWNALEDQRIERALIAAVPEARAPIVAMANEVFESRDAWAGFLVAERPHVSREVRASAISEFRSTFGEELWQCVATIVREYVLLADNDLDEMVRLTDRARRLLDPTSPGWDDWIDDLFEPGWDLRASDPCPYADWFGSQDDLPMRDQRNPNNGKPMRRKP